MLQDLSMMFRDRAQAATMLVDQLEPLVGRKNPLILGIPRGSVPMACQVAERLGGDCDLVLVHKIGAPGNEEFAIGSVSEFGSVHVNPNATFYGFSSKLVHDLGREQIAMLQRRRKLYSPARAPLDPRGRVVVILDDGIATGLTMIAAIQAIRDRRPERIIVAAPVASPEAAERIAELADDVVFLDTPDPFFAIGDFYEDFSQVSDEEVMAALNAAQEARRAGKSA